MDKNVKRCSSAPIIQLSNAFENYLSKDKKATSVSHNPVTDLLKLSQVTCVDDWLPLRNQEFELVNPWATPQCQPSSSYKRITRKKNGLVQVDKRFNPDFNTGIWDSSVERHSYRYVPNNSCYKSMKLQAALIKANPPRRKPAGPVILTTAQRKLQRELTRELRKEFQTIFDGADDSYFKIRNSFVETEEDGEERPYKPLNKLEKSSVNHHEISQSDMSRGLESKSAQPSSNIPDSPINVDRPRSSFAKCLPSSDRTANDAKILGGEVQKLRRRQKRIMDKQAKLSSFSHTVSSKDRVEALAEQTFNISKSDSEQLESVKTSKIRDKPVGLTQGDQLNLHDNTSENIAQDRSLCTDIMARGIFPADNVHGLVRQKAPYPPSFHGQNYDHLALKIPSNQPSQKIMSKPQDAKLKIPQPSKKFVEFENAVDEDLQAFLPSICGKGITTRLGSLH